MCYLHVCRICEKQSHLIDISINSNYIEHYLIVGNVSYDENDGLPQFLCRFCITQLLHFIKFKQKCKETYEKFHGLLLQQTKLEVKTEFNEDEYDGIPVSEYTNIETLNYTPIHDRNDNNALLTEITNEIVASDKDNSVDFENAIDKEITTEVSSKNISKLNTMQYLQCDICNTKMMNKLIFEGMQNLELHMSKFHRMAKNLRQCEQCGHNSELFPYLQLYVHNKNNLHNDSSIKPYIKCEICGRTFSSKQDLIIHTRNHTREKRYTCDYCYKCYSNNACLAKHILRLHTDEKPYKCENCNKTFSYKQGLVEHTRKHTCDYCHKCFSNSSYLVNHTRIHTGEKPYKCDYCHKSYSSRRNLDHHTRTHIHTILLSNL